MKRIEVKEEDLIYNLNSIKKFIKDDTKIIAVVKANGMGLGLIEYSNFLVQNGIDCLAVANIEEAILLRNAGITTEILMLTPSNSENELKLLIENNITITIGNLDELLIAENICKNNNFQIKAHIKIDTGFGRYGFLYTEKDNILSVFKNSANVKIDGIFTHFSNPIDEKFTENQFARFNNCIKFIKENGFEVNVIHACATTATMKYPHMQLNAVRIGSGIQGRVLINKDKFKKVGIFKANINEIKYLPKGYNISYNNIYKTKRESKIAIIPVGYIDGLNRNKLRDDFTLKNNIICAILEIRKIFMDNSLKIKINDKKYKIIGKLGMFHAIVDITGSSDINVGDEVVLDVAPIQANDEIRREYI